MELFWCNMQEHSYYHSTHKLLASLHVAQTVSSIH